MSENKSKKEVVEVDSAYSPAVADIIKKAYWRQETIILEYDGVKISNRGRCMFRCNLCGLIDYKSAFEQHHTRYIGPETITIVCRDCHQRIHHDDRYHNELKPNMSRADAKDQRNKPLRGASGAGKVIQPGDYETVGNQRKRWIDAP